MFAHTNQDLGEQSDPGLFGKLIINNQIGLVKVKNQLEVSIYHT